MLFTEIVHDQKIQSLLKLYVQSPNL